MDANKKSWLTGCGCGCGCAIPSFLTFYGLGVFFSWFLWEVADIREDVFEPPLALVWPVFIGLLVGGLLGLITVFVARSIAKRRVLKREEEQLPPVNPPQAPPPQAPPGPPQQPHY